MRKFRFIGTEEQAKGYHNSPTTGQIYPEHYLVGSSRSDNISQTKSGMER